MRRSLILLAAVVSALAVAACGSSKSSSASGAGTAPAPLASALSYFPGGTPLIVTFQTDPAAPALKTAMKNQTTASTAVKAAFFQELAKLGIDYNRDVKPLFGNPVALGIGTADATSASTPFLGAWQTSNQTALKRLVSEIKGLSAHGTHDGATLYTASGVALAVKGPMVLVSDSTDALHAALDRHQAQSGFSAAEYARYTSGLPSNSAASAVGDLHSALAQPSAAKALKVPWVAAITGYGLTVDGTTSAADVHFKLDTTGKPLSEAQLPFASGPSAPALAATMPIQFALRDPGAVWTFVVGTAKQAQPSEAQKITRGEAKLKAASGVDFEQLVRSVTGDLQIESDGHAVLGRVPVSDASAVNKLLATQRTNGMFKGDTVRPLGGGLYRVAGSTDPSNPTIAGMVGKEFVFGERSTPAALRAYATASTTAASASGAIAFKVSPKPLIAATLARASNPLLGQLADRLGDITGSVQASPSGLTGEATVRVDSGS